MSKPRRIAIALDLVDPHPNHQDVFAGVQRYAHEVGSWQCVIDEHPAYRYRQRQNTRGAYDGVIARALPTLQTRLKKLGIPLINTVYSYHRDGVAGVYLDPFSRGQLAAEHLLGRGYSRIHVLHDPSMRHTVDTMSTFIAHVEDEGIQCQVTEFAGGDTSDPAWWVKHETFINRWIDTLQPPIGLFLESAIASRVIIELCHQKGLHVPQDIAVMCMRNPKSLLELPTQISSVEHNYERVGYEAAVMLDRLIDGEPVPTRPTLIPPKGVAARASTDHFAVDDELVAQALRYISQHLRADLSVERMAEALDVSSRNLQKRFQLALHRGVASEIRRLRLSASKIMLVDSDQSIGDIAERAGFVNAAAMGQVYRRELGYSPSAYREKHRG